MLRIFATVFLMAMLSMPTKADTKKEEPPKTTEPTQFQQCDNALRQELITPKSAVIFFHDFNEDGTHHKKVNVGVICYETRTRGGGFAKAAGRCTFGEDKKLSHSQIYDRESAATFFCY